MYSMTGPNSAEMKSGVASMIRQLCMPAPCARRAATMIAYSAGFCSALSPCQARSTQCFSSHGALLSCFSCRPSRPPFHRERQCIRGPLNPGYTRRCAQRAGRASNFNAQCHNPLRKVATLLHHMPKVAAAAGLASLFGRHPTPRPPSGRWPGQLSIQESSSGWAHAAISQARTARPPSRTLLPDSTPRPRAPSPRFNQRSSPSRPPFLVGQDAHSAFDWTVSPGLTRCRARWAGRVSMAFSLVIVLRVTPYRNRRPRRKRRR